ncbi:MAG: ATP-binding cassette domain-containing protein [Syntrophobacteraceae bacterium]|jgi:tungstate transport system ATP-binding protein|nr:ATP-binding cassette domain-containing protein [Syntrophobacteraceae bacterium]
MIQGETMVGVEDLRLELGGRQIYHIDRLAIRRAEVLALVGPNGAGKSSLLLTLALLQKPTSGTVEIDGEAARNGNALGLRRKMAVVFQQALLLDMTVRQNLLAALRIRGIPRREALERVAYWLDRFGISSLAQRPARVLSGGEAQRASLARAFALEPRVLLLDEPFAALDYPTRKALLNDLGGLLSEMSMTALFVTHDYTEIPYLAERVAVLHQGRIVKDGSLREVFGEDMLKRSLWAPWET